MKVLPFDSSTGLPQKIAFKYGVIAYTAFISYNPAADLYTIVLRRTLGGQELYRGKLVEDFYNNIKDEITKEVLFTLYVKNLSKTEMEIWVLEGSA